MDKLHYTEREILYMTPRKFEVMLSTYIDYHGGRSTTGGTIDDLP